MTRWNRSPEEVFQDMLVTGIETSTTSCAHCQDGYVPAGAPKLQEDADGSPCFGASAQLCPLCEGSGKIIPDPYIGGVVTGLIAGLIPTIYPLIDSHDSDKQEYGMRLLKCCYDHVNEYHRRTAAAIAEDEKMVERLRFFGDRFSQRHSGEHPPLEVFEDNPPAPSGALTDEELHALLNSPEKAP